MSDSNQITFFRNALPILPSKVRRMIDKETINVSKIQWVYEKPLNENEYKNKLKSIKSSPKIFSLVNGIQFLLSIFLVVLYNYFSPLLVTNTFVSVVGILLTLYNDGIQTVRDVASIPKEVWKKMTGFFTKTTTKVEKDD